MKMGTIASPWRYDEGAGIPLWHANARLTSRWCYDDLEGGEDLVFRLCYELRVPLDGIVISKTAEIIVPSDVPA
jgi:hypothetical protein